MTYLGIGLPSSWLKHKTSGLCLGMLLDALWKPWVLASELP